MERKTKQKQIPIIPWNTIWDGHAQQGMKPNVSRRHPTE